MKRIYLDYAATTPCDERVVEAMRPYFAEKFGNPSSIHSFGQETRAAVEKARDQVANLIGAKPEEIVFTSGGTEADNFALFGALYANQKKGDHIIVSAVEHHAVIETAEVLKKRGFKVTVLPVDKFGLVDPEALVKAVTDKTVLVSVMHANNEMGTIEPIKELGTRIKELGIIFHTDAVQTVGHIPVNVDEMGVSLLAASAHKFYGPKGAGFLYIRKGTRIEPLIHGGSQEKNRRASTENVAGIVGMGAAAEIAKSEMKAESDKLVVLRDKLVKGLLEKIPDTILNGHPEKRLPNNVNVSIKYVEGESMLLNLDHEGIAASTGSACTSGSLEPSHVMMAIGLPHEVAHGSLRFSLGKYTTDQEIDILLSKLPGIVSKLREMSPLYQKGKK